MPYYLFMRKFLRKFFWSHGTPLGYLGSLSQKGLPEIFSKWFLINLSNPLRHPAPLVDPLLTKKLDTAGPWCVLLSGKRVVSPFIWAEKLSDWYFCAIIFLGPIQVCNVFIFGQFRVLLCFVQTVKKKWLSTQILCKFSFLAHYMFFQNTWKPLERHVKQDRMLHC